MNKEKISSQEIIDLVASKASVSKRAAEEFLKVMIATIEDALLSGDVVKIKNFGTFKLQWNEPRKSVNVQTGEEIILPGYHKVSFTPDAILKDVVNEPFAHLEPVVLDGDNDFVIPDKKEDEVLDPLRIFTEQASEIKDLLSEINALSAPPKRKERENKEIVIKDYFDLEEYTDAKVEEKVPEVSIIDAGTVVAEPDVAEPFAEEEEPDKQPEIVVSAEPVTEETKVDEVNVYIPESKPEQYTTATVDSNSVFESTPFLVGVKPRRRSKKWLWISLAGVIVLAFIGLYLFFPPVNKIGNDLVAGAGSGISNVVGSIKRIFITEPKKAPVTETVVIPKDTAVVDTMETKEPVDSLQLLFDNPRVYDEFIGTEQINAGSRLTVMSKKYYGSKDFWVYIYEANKERIQNPDNIEMGTLIRIPKLDPRLIDASNPRCIQKALELHDKYVKKKSQGKDSSN